MSDTELKLQRIAALLPLLRQLTVKQVIEAGDAAIDAAGLNPWCLKEGLVEGSEPAVSEWRITESIAAIEAIPRQPDPQVTALVEALRRIKRATHSEVRAGQAGYVSRYGINGIAATALNAWEQSNG